MRRMNVAGRSVRKSCTAALFASVLLLCSCATKPQRSAVGPGPRLPGDVTMNKDAGRGGHLFISLRLAGGEELPFIIDTGSPITVLDKSLEPQLGKCLDTHTLNNFGTEYVANAYAAPRLYLGDAVLETGDNALTCDLIAKMSSGEGRPVLGILGTDCLQHYCIQLDFRAGKMRFLDPDRVKPAQLGKAFPLTFSREGQTQAQWVRPYIHHDSFVGGPEADLLIDTGYDLDGALEWGLFCRGIQQRTLRVEADANDANEPRNAYLSNCVWDGGAYTDLYVGHGGKPTEINTSESSLGLRFLARHLVTFDFPRRTMYLKQTHSGPLVDREVRAAARAAGHSVFKAAGRMIRNGQLPGWSKEDRGRFAKTFRYRPDPDTVNLEALKQGDSSVYHYQFTRASKEDLWMLRRAWRADQDDRTIQEYPIP